MGGYDSGSDSKDGRDEDDEVGNQLLGFMFGNVDNAGDLDVDYLDEVISLHIYSQNNAIHVNKDVKEHLVALADKLGSSLTDIDLSVKSPQTPAGAVEQGDVVCQENLSHAVFDVLMNFSGSRDEIC
ncbi:hypothetical protein Ddye_014766 [Dipteronia dyeriana]|uniref:TAFII-230 TBP-binding domain-containing protein n=1 Tax=Dipteronia dyeriana TaxID=168575 RepID=A0AAD9U418_9ROSI|nr:hypothetical protein Ddye_014766 [Dipteronia dyeriana]